MSPTVTLRQVNADKLPITCDQIQEIVENHKDDFQSMCTKDLIDSIIEFLCSKSTKYKYIVTAKKIAVSENIDNEVNAGLGACWDNDNDGVLQLQADCGSYDGSFHWVIITIVFVSPF